MLSPKLWRGKKAKLFNGRARSERNCLQPAAAVAYRGRISFDRRPILPRAESERQLKLIPSAEFS